jgi:hypothetical protein
MTPVNYDFEIIVFNLQFSIYPSVLEVCCTYTDYTSDLTEVHRTKIDTK